MTAVVETGAQLRAQAMRDSATAFADPRLIALVEDALRDQERIATAFQRLRQLAVIEEFLRAHRAAGEASERVRLTDTGGWADDEAERLDVVAEAAWHEVVAGWHVMQGSWASRLFVVKEAREAGAEYVGRRRRVVGHAVAQSGPLDWSQAGRAA